MLRSTMFVVAMAYGLAACGDDCDGGSGGFFGSRAAERGSLALATLEPAVLVDVGNTVIVEVTSTLPADRCSVGLMSTTRFVWEPAQGRAVATTAVPSASARRITGAMLGGGVTSWEDAVPGLTIRASRDSNFNLLLTFTSGMATALLTCSSTFSTTCM